MAMEMRRHQLVVFPTHLPHGECSLNRVDAMLCGCSGRTLRDIILHRRSNSPCCARHRLVIRSVVLLEPKAKLETILDGLILPGNLLISVQKGPHMVTSNLAATVGPHITCRILLGQEVTARLRGTRVVKANLGISINQLSLGLAKWRRSLSADAHRHVRWHQSNGPTGPVGVVRQRSLRSVRINKIQGCLLGIERKHIPFHLARNHHSPDVIHNGTGLDGKCCRKELSGIMVGKVTLCDVAVALDNDCPRSIRHSRRVESKPKPNIRRPRYADCHIIARTIHRHTELHQAGGRPCNGGDVTTTRSRCL
mmetsp:Transcript_126973/g.290515  ORF Transcript_126973/g.290515 Transcript_126973/m.290515 type:complete len:309 (-) Transcript_126973:1025-1951(-)